MTDSGSGDPFDPTRPPSVPGDPGRVERPRFGDEPSSQFRPGYGGEPTAGAPPPSAPARDPWWQVVAPIAAGAIVLAGVAFLVVRGGADDGSLETTGSEPNTTEARAQQPADPVIETTVPPPDTLPPLQTTLPPARPTQTELDGALVDIGLLEDGWVEVSFEEGDVCLGDDFSDREAGTANATFQQDVPELNVIRQISQIVTAYVDADAAAEAFSNELAALLACNETTVDVDGFTYDLLVQADEFEEAELGDAPCRDQNVSVIAQFSNPDNLVPFVAQALFAFRCGSNVVASTMTTTLDLADLNNPAFIQVSGEGNTATAALPGSG